MSKQNQLLFDEYKRKARLYPAMLLSIPGAFLIWGILAFWKFELTAIIMSIVGMLAFCEDAAVWFAATMLSWLGNCLQDRIFEQGKRFPTTEMLLWGDNDI